MNYLLIYENDIYQEIPFMESLHLGNIDIVYQNKQFKVKDIVIDAFTLFDLEGKQACLLTDEKQTFILDEKLLVAKENAHINLKNIDVKLIVDKWQLQVVESDTSIYINGVKLEGNLHILQVGDILQVKEIRFIFKERELDVLAKSKDYVSTLEIATNDFKYFEGFPFYSRSPRIVKTINEDDISIINPPAEDKMGAKGILATFAPTILTSLASVGVGLMLGRGMMLLMTVSSTIIAFFTNLFKYFSDRKESKLKNAKRISIFDDYLLRKRKEIFERYESVKEAMEYNSPSLKEIEENIQNYSSRIYERSNNDEDFIELCIGYKDGLAPFKIELQEDELEMEKDHLKEEAKGVQRQFSKMDNQPVHIDLKEAHVGLVGEKFHVHEQLKAYLFQLTFFQSYHDLEIIYLYNEKYFPDFSYLKWYPHLKMRAINVRTAIHNERMRDQILGSVYQILKDRSLKQEENKKEAKFAPHLLFVIDEPSMILNHSIMEYLQLEMGSLAYSIIYTTNKKAKLPENIKTVISFDDRENGTLVLNNGRYENRKFHLLNGREINYEKNARTLATLVHEEKMMSQIPEAIDFLELYNIQSVEELNLVSTWQKNVAYKSLSVPLGVRAKDDIVYLDLHEKAHGPHGLVAGTTGSGKSEIIQSYILSLAVNFHPHDVGFLLIDYKGGGMANLFRELPHLLGTITNLDGSESMRALVSIKSELKRRQRIFDEHGVNNINAYHKLFKSNKAREPLPHLFLISDEFAELKKEQPEFMKELVSTARIGRSLGVHLILATQKPTGVVDEQIWSNSKFKLCLKVASESDSKELLKTPDAANITQPGRSYLQVGNNEIYELFQSAYSGAAYDKGTQEEKKIDNRVYVINELGQGQVVNDDLSATDGSDKLQETQLDRIIEYVHDEFITLNSAEVRKPWLPALPTKLINEHNQQHVESDDVDLICDLGMIDIPEQQLQETYKLNLEVDGNILYVASSGFGKSMFLSNILINLANKNSVEQLNYYILDFGNSALIPFNQLPHTADYITLDDDEKFNKFLKLIQNEITSRKKLLAKENVQNFALYNKVCEDKMKAIVVAIDHMDVLKERGLEIETIFTKLARDGVSLGIYMIMTSSRSADIRHATLNQIKNKVVGYVFEQAEANQLVGRSEWKLTEVKGRVLVKTDDVHLAQIYLPVDFEDDVDYLQQVKAKVEEIKKYNDGNVASRIAVLPDELFFSDLSNYPKANPYDYVLGLDLSSVEQRGSNLVSDPFLIIGPTKSGKTTALSNLIQQVKGKKYVLDTRKMNLNKFIDEADIEYAYHAEKYQEIIQELYTELTQREASFMKALEEDKLLTPAQYYASLEPITFFIDDLDYLNEVMGASLEGAKVFAKAVETGIYFFVGGDSAKMPTSNQYANIFRRATTGLVLGACAMVNPFNIIGSNTPKPGNGVLISEEGSMAIRMAKGG